MDDSISLTTPKPFVFVLMPFNENFEDIYRIGIKEAAEKVGAYAERVDEQIFTEGILERIFNQISKADVIVADMTDKNPNVYYEVGYAHALGKIVLLLTQDAEDIPFDLRNKQHIIYGNDGGKIGTLREKLQRKLEWAINEAKNKKDHNCGDNFIVSLFDETQRIPQITKLNEDSTTSLLPVIYLRLLGGSGFDPVCKLKISIHNFSLESLHIKRLYFYISDGSAFQPVDSKFSDGEGGILCYNEEVGSDFVWKFAMDTHFPQILPNASETARIPLTHAVHLDGPGIYKIRIHTSQRYYDFPFKIESER